MEISPSTPRWRQRSFSLPSFPLPLSDALLSLMPALQPLTEFLRKETAGNRDILLSPASVDIYSARLTLLMETNTTHLCEEPVLEFLDSYLRYKNRWFDFRDGRFRGRIAGDHTDETLLSNQVLAFLQRMSSTDKPCTDSTSNSTESKNTTYILRGRNWLDFPKLMDICAIYGRDNPSITREMVKKAVGLNPTIVNDISAALSYFIETFVRIYDRCFEAHEKLDEFPRHEVLTRNQQKNDLLLIMDYLNDAIVTMHSLISVYWPAAIYLSRPTKFEKGEHALLNVLGRMHDLLLPLYQKGLTNVPVSLNILLTRIAKLGWSILDISYLSREHFVEILDFETGDTIFPALVPDPELRGDIIFKVLRRVNKEVTAHICHRMDHIPFLCSMEGEYKILARLTNLCNQGWIFLDDSQFEEISILATTYFLKYREERILKMRNHQADALLQPKIDEIRDIFPHYSKGFILACLKFYKKNVEEVIYRISNNTLDDFFLRDDPTKDNISIILYNP